jgi:hypothetical protein
MTVAHDEPAVTLGRAEHDNLVIARRIALHTMKAARDAAPNGLARNNRRVCGAPLMAEICGSVLTA